MALGAEEEGFLTPQTPFEMTWLLAKVGFGN